MAVDLVSQRIDASFLAPRDDTLVTWLGMAGVLINTRGTVLLIDPLIARVERNGEMRSEAGYRLKIALPIEAQDVPRADAVLYTHADGDHFGAETARVLERRLHPLFLAPAPMAQRLRALGVERLVTVNDFETHRVGAAEVQVTPALHDYPARNPFQRGDCCGYVVRTPDGSIWHPGDSRLIPELLEVKGVDVLFRDGDPLLPAASGFARRFRQGCAPPVRVPSRPQG